MPGGKENKRGRAEPYDGHARAVRARPSSAATTVSAWVYAPSQSYLQRERRRAREGKLGVQNTGGAASTDVVLAVPECRSGFLDDNENRKRMAAMLSES